MRIHLAPLRERTEDIPLLVQHFIEKYAAGQSVSMETDALAVLKSARWSGNVRELGNVVERAVLLCRGGRIRIGDLPGELLASSQESEYHRSLEEVEKTHIRKVLQHAKDYDEAARILGIDPATLWRKRKKYGL